MSFKYVQLENGQSCHETEMASTSEQSTVYTGHLEETTRHLSMLGSVTRQSFSLIAIWSNQNQFYERRKNDSESNRCRSVIKQQPQPSDCYRQINAISNKRYQSTISQRSRSSFFDMTVSYLFDSWHQCHHSFHIHPLIFILFFAILLHCVSILQLLLSLPKFRLVRLEITIILYYYCPSNVFMNFSCSVKNYVSSSRVTVTLSTESTRIEAVRLILLFLVFTSPRVGPFSGIS